MKKYIKVFKIPFLVLAVFLVLGISCKIIAANRTSTGFVRSNPECTTERVFDYADVLTREEEEQLREQIAAAENACGTDIVIVTLNESLEEYARMYGTKQGTGTSIDAVAGIEPYQYTMVFADDFYDEEAFGYNKPHGDGVLLLDNWYREADGKIYSWMSTSGKAQTELSSEDIDEILDQSLEYVDDDPAYAYGRFVELVEVCMGPGEALDKVLGGWISVAIGLVAGVIFLGVNFGARRGKKTVETRTYVKNGSPNIKERQDLFLTKTVTRRKIETQSSGGGGHTSSGGFSHGGGGHSR